MLAENNEALPPLYPARDTKNPSNPEAVMPHHLKPLPYSHAALEPHYDTETLKIHHGKHHQAYVDNLNKLLADQPALAAKNLDELLTGLNAVPSALRQKVTNNAGGVWNHDFFWAGMGPGKGGTPSGKLAALIDASFGGFETFKTKFKESALAQFGSGWTWLTLADDGDLEIENSSNQDCPLSKGHKPLLTLDVWEHAYYLKFQNRRAEWIDAWWNVVDWDAVTARL
jgi:Fe-Mn family superoxide dismutase